MKQSIEERIQTTVEWLREKKAEAKAQGLIIGVSGGVDSAVVAGLCKRSFPDNSLGVILPSHSNPADREDALLIANTLGLRTIEVDLSTAHTDIFNRVGNALRESNIDISSEKIEQLSQGNLKARLRMSTIYTVANALNYLVVGTDNAPESYTGYFTKYGDGGVDVLPISSLTKTEVRIWAKALGLPNQIANRVPTAGLWPGQTDEGEMGVTYDMLDQYLLGEEVPLEVRERVEILHQVSEHKRHTPPSITLDKVSYSWLKAQAEKY